MEAIQTMANNVDDALTGLLNSAASIEKAEEAVLSFVQGLPAVLEAAIATAWAAGATPAQLTAFADLTTRLNNDSAKITSDLVNPVMPATITPPPALSGD